MTAEEFCRATLASARQMAREKQNLNQLRNLIYDLTAIHELWTVEHAANAARERHAVQDAR
jgi:hypothetical protein